MSETNGNGATPEPRILSLDGARKPKDRGSDFATKADVVRLVADEVSKVHEYYLNQIPPFTGRMIQDALLSYGLIKVVPGTTDIAPIATAETSLEGTTRVADATPSETIQ